jgi:hypothetical protein
MSAGSMTAQYLSNPTAQQGVMNSLFTAFAGFIAFGAAIVAVLTRGGAVQSLADSWVGQAKKEDPNDHWAWIRNPILILPLTLIICLMVLGSGAGLLFSFCWLRAGGSGWGWAYSFSVDLFEAEVFGITLATLAAVLAAAWSSIAAVMPPFSAIVSRARAVVSPVIRGLTPPSVSACNQSAILDSAEAPGALPPGQAPGR